MTPSCRSRGRTSPCACIQQGSWIERSTAGSPGVRSQSIFSTPTLRVNRHCTQTRCGRTTLAPYPLLRDRELVYARRFRDRLKSLGVRDIMTQARSPCQNGHVERLIGSIHWECLDHVIVLNEKHLMRVMEEFVRYYNRSRTHLGLDKASPDGRAVEPPSAGPIKSRPEVGGLHHRYHREAA